jgi:hypothetical protein
MGGHQVGGRIERHHAPLLHQGDPVAQGLGLFKIVRGQDDRMALAVQATDELPQALAQFDIDAGRRLVKHDDRRLVHQRLSDQHTALHAARQPAHVDVGLARQIEVGQDFVDPVIVLADAEISGLDAQGFRTLKNGSKTSSCGTTPSKRRASRKSRITSCPMTLMVPESGRTRPASEEISVVLPAPFGPSKPKNSPWPISSDTPASA